VSTLFGRKWRKLFRAAVIEKLQRGRSVKIKTCDHKGKIIRKEKIRPDGFAV
jgi:hypothetical protein